MSLWLQGQGEGWEEGAGSQGVWGDGNQYHIVKLKKNNKKLKKKEIQKKNKIGNEQMPTEQHREVCPKLHNNLNGKRI